MIAYLVIRMMESDVRSALPDAPVVPHSSRDSGKGKAWGERTRGRMATAFHRIAWALEPVQGDDWGTGK
ncbi:hypothetical protein StoSoilB3_42170 (plasmid) [Arthrobacter sp. StoSoilB3]|nr:hypothetical protein StoSoilB3_42170 [Arthrobacter sp. StoSoilB3]